MFVQPSLSPLIDVGSIWCERKLTRCLRLRALAAGYGIAVL
jgi:hypothetical protein